MSKNIEGQVDGPLEIEKEVKPEEIEKSCPACGFPTKESWSGIHCTECSWFECY